MELNAVARASGHVRDLLSNGQIAHAGRVLMSLRTADRADVFARLTPLQQDAIISQLSPVETASILQYLEDEEAAKVASRIDAARLAHVVDTMEPDEAADLINDINPALASSVLHAMEHWDDVQPLLRYPDDSAGGLMTVDYVQLSPRMQAQEALGVVRQHVPRGKQGSHFLVLGTGQELLGVVSVFAILSARATAPVGELMDPDVLHVRVWDRAEDVAQFAARYHLDAVPVVDDGDRLLGIITSDDLVGVLEDAATEDAQRFGGSAPLRRHYSRLSASAVAAKRVGWLALLFATGALTAAIVGLHQDILDRAVALAMFIPLLIGSGGNAGSQTTATVIRALATRDVEPRDALRVLWREFRVGLLLGGVMSLGGYVVAQLAGASDLVSLTVASSLLAILVWSSLVAAMLPLAARAVGIDPALICGPLMGTLVDTIGLLIYFTVARMILP